MTLILTLKHTRNPDIVGGYWQHPIDPAKAVKVEVADFAEASKVCTAYIARNGLGGGNWTGGDLREGGKVIANVAYNGTIWPGASRDWKPGQPRLYPVQAQAVAPVHAA